MVCVGCPPLHWFDNGMVTHPLKCDIVGMLWSMVNSKALDGATTLVMVIARQPQSSVLRPFSALTSRISDYKLAQEVIFQG